MGSKIQLKRLTSTDIDQSTVVLAVGEPCLAKDTDNKEYIVFGDGTTPIKDLVREPLGDSGMVSLTTDDTLDGAGSTTDPLGVAISALPDNMLSVESDGLYVPKVIKVSTKSLLPTTGNLETVYIVSDEKHIYYWDGTNYIQLTQDFTGMVYKGSVNKVADLPTTNLTVGDFYWVVDDALFKIYNGTTWDTITLAKNIQGDFADTVTTSPSYIQNKKAQYITYVPDSDGITSTDVQAAIEELDELVQDKQDKVPTAKLNNYASWDNAGQTKDSGDAKTLTINPLDVASDNKIPSEKAVAKVKADLEDAMKNQATSSAADQGDKAILPLILNAEDIYNIRPVSAINGDYNDDYFGGYVLTGAQASYLGRTFNKIKLMIFSPGWIRVGIVRGTGIDEYDGVARGCCKATPTYSGADVYPTSLIPEGDEIADGGSHKTLKKWLVCQWVATPGLHEWDIPDEIITSPLEYIYLENRQGVSGWAMNRSGAAATQKGLSIPNNTIINGGSWPTSFLTTTNFNSGSFAVSNNMLDASARPTYSANSSHGKVYSSWVSTDHSRTVDSSISKGAASNYLNIGLYLSGTGGNQYLDPIVENCITVSIIPGGVASVLAGYGPDYNQQQKLVGKEIYGIELIVTVPGDLTFYVFSSNNPATARVVKQFTLKTRAIGRQLIHLPETVVLKDGQWCGVSGVTEAIKNKPTAAQFGTTTINKGYVDTCKFAYHIPTVSNWTQKGEDPTGVQNLLPYSSAIKDYSVNTFTYWSGVTYNPTTGQLDFSGASIINSTNEYLNVSLVVRDQSRSKLEDLNYSVTGDSISTYAGQISQTTDFGVVTNAAGNNAVFYPNAGSGETVGIDSTWWGALGKMCRMRLIKNDAWSGSHVGGTDSNTSSSACASQIRTRMLNSSNGPQTAVTSGLGTPYGSPDVVFCMIGTNDLSGNRAAGAYSNTAPTDISTLVGAFETMVARHKTNYPATKFVYFLIPRGNQSPYPYTNANGLSISQLASEFEYVANAFGAFFVPLGYFSDLFSARTVSGGKFLWTATSGVIGPRYETASAACGVDWLHPTAIGHQIIASGLQRFCEERF